MTGICVRGDAVEFPPYPNPRGTTVTATFPGRHDRARHFAAGVAAIHDGTTQPSEDLQFWQLAVAYLHWGAPKVQVGSMKKYWNELQRWVLPAIGSIPLHRCDLDTYQAIFTHLDNHDTSESERRGVARTVGAVASWAAGSSWWTLPTDPFGLHSARNKVKYAAFAKGASVDIAAGRTVERITTDMCPTLDQTIEFGAVLADVAEDLWGPSARYVGDAPIVQYLTGMRLGELLAAQVDDFDLRSHMPTVYIPRQYDKTKRCTPVGPITKAPKSKRPRHAALWTSTSELLTDIVGRARAEGRGVLFVPTKAQTSWFRRFEVAYGIAAGEAAYPYTSHWHRHAYCSLNLASRDENGFGRSAAAVAAWVGHRDPEVLRIRYWHPLPLEDGWSDHWPGAK